MKNRTLEELRSWVSRTPGAVLEEDVPPNPLDLSQAANTVNVVLVGSQLLFVETLPWTEPGTYAVSEDRCLWRNGELLPDSVPSLNAGLLGWLDYLDLDACVTAIVGLNSYSKVFRDRAWYTSPFRIVVASELGDLLDEWFRRLSEYDKRHENEAIRRDVRAAAARTPEEAPLQSYRERVGEDPPKAQARLEAFLTDTPFEARLRWQVMLRRVRRSIGWSTP